jgi:hypothetical protein|tara:strand:+ start:3012 stop:3683 length:672 start_codon:yes stop_codon:yes gene_type:complete
MAKQLLVDYSVFKVSPKMIAESQEQNDGKVIVTGCLQRANAPNQNERIYPRAILEREANKYKATFIKENRALGELDHPESSVVNLSNVSHNVRDIWWQGDELMGKVEILSTPAGNILKTLLGQGITVGISSRGLGSVKESTGGTTVEVQDDFELVCWDFVSNPSTHGAFMSPMNESINKSINKYTKVNSIISEMLCEMTGTCGIPKKKSPCGCGGCGGKCEKA